MMTFGQQALDRVKKLEDKQAYDELLSKVTEQFERARLKQLAAEWKDSQQIEVEVIEQSPTLQ